jgi:UDP-GlcNAc:undecaprenyl-phosphate/decaprenyl-phosphate GlcNAc-1-phosphate transferase
MEAPNLEIHLLIFFGSMVASSSLVPLMRLVAFRYSILDNPNQSHKTHSQSTPYLGGLVIVIPITIFALIGPFIFFDNLDYLNRVLTFVLPALLLSLVGLYDDLKNISANFRLLVQSLLALAITIYLMDLGFIIRIFENNVANTLLSIFWLIGITNAFNFFDNLDGGAAGITVIASSSLFVLSFWTGQYLISSFCIVLAGSTLGFLYWNKNPARIYLGDSGALFIGFLLAITLLQFQPRVESQFASVLTPVFILAIPIIDTTVAVVSRLLIGVSIFQGGRDHLSHRLISKGLTRRASAYVLWGASSIFSFVSLALYFVSNNTAEFLSVLTLICMGLLVVWFLSIEVHN